MNDSDVDTASLPAVETASRPAPSFRKRALRRASIYLLLIACCHLTLCGWLAWETVRPRQYKLRETPQEYKLNFENIAFVTPDKLTLRGWLIPSDGKARGIIVCCHGVDSDRTDLLATAATLHKAGYAVMLFDFRARGESEGRLCTLGYREVDDLLAAIHYVQSRPESTHLPLGLIGESMGGAVVLMGAARCPDVKAVIAESPFARLDHAVNNHFHAVMGASAPLLAVPTQAIGQMFIGKNCAEIAPVEEIARIAPRPLLLIEDGSDTLCPPAETQALLQAAGQPKSLWHVPGAIHTNAQNVAPTEYARRVTSFFNTTIPAVNRH